MTSSPRAHVLVLRWGEIFLKGRNRPFFEGRLVDNIRRAVKDVPDAKVKKLHGRVIVTCDDATVRRAIDRVTRVFGLQSISPAVSLPRTRSHEADLQAIGDEAVALARGAARTMGGGKPTFKIETRRTDKAFPLTSIEISREVGARVVGELDLPVDVHAPQLEIGVELGLERSFVFSQTIPGPGGLPVGVTGRVNLLLSGGIDSPVAGWLAMKRGCAVSATYLHSFPYTGDRTKEKVIDLARLLVPWHGPINLHVVGFTEAQKQLRDAGRADLAVVLYRRMMMRVACRIAAAEKALAVVTGENLAQVASQTLENLGVIEEASTLPVLRPLLTYDKLETIALAQRIGTFETSIQPYEDCCQLFVPSNPVTRARLQDAIDAEAGLDVTAIADDLANRAERIVVE
jgi:thiamine biosynthesis protein ThiI